MKFKIDENIPFEVAEHLKAAGHDAHTVGDENLQGSPDPVVLDAARREGRVLLTMDIGIGDVRVYPPAEFAGIVLFRTKVTGRKMVLQFVRQRLDDVLKLSLHGKLLVVSESGIRVR